jgi:sugar phosphate isomerase/epimerase
VAGPRTRSSRPGGEEGGIVARQVRYGVAVSEEQLGEAAPVLFQGGIESGIARAAELGFETVELHVRDPRALDPERIRAVACAHGVAIAAIGTGLEHTLNGLSLTSPEAEARRQAVEKMRQHVDFAAHFGAVVFLGLIRGRCGTQALVPEFLDLVADGFGRIAEYAAERGVPTGLEPVAYYFSDLLNTTEETLEFLTRPGLESIGLLLDTHHMFMEDRDVAASIAACAGRITHFHASDSNRRYPGAGNVDWEMVARALDAAGYDRSVSIEALPRPSGEEAARMGLATLRALWGV